jgi:2-methylcitrate dehydratase PrpD
LLAQDAPLKSALAHAVGRCGKLRLKQLKLIVGYEPATELCYENCFLGYRMTDSSHLLPL